ncbi:rnf213a [Symbiodinium sp. CCMP2456]|nr:rnf213a [Symbiodinium sp. CCMP2456]
MDRRGGDIDLCRIGAFALKPEGVRESASARHSKTASGRVPGAHLGWFPLDGRRLPNLSNDLPDPFATGLNLDSAMGTEALFAVHPSKVHFVPQAGSEKTLKWSLDLDFERNQNQRNKELGLEIRTMYLEICGAVGAVASSSRATKDEFDKAVHSACQANIGSWARGKAFGRSVLACIVSRVLLNRQVAVPEGLEVLRDWVSENLDTEKSARHRNRCMLANRMFSGLLPHLQEVTEEADSTDVDPRKFRKFLEQLANHLALLVLGAGTQPAGWLEQVLNSPGEAQRSYWPTMPDSEEAAVVGAMGYVGWYTCPNGHPYSVGECTRPMQKGICPAPGCGAPIGGEHHQNVQGVRTINEDRLLRLELGGSSRC